VNARAAVTPIALIVLAAGATAYALLVDRHAISDVDRAARRHDAFPSFRVDEVARVELGTSTETIVLERAATGDAGSVSPWVLSSPRREPADPGAVDVLLRAMELGQRVRDVGDEVATGLDAPRVRGAVTMGEVVLRFEVGAPAPRPDGAAYMRVEGEGAFVIGRALATQLLRGSDAYRQRALIPLGASAVARIDVRSRAGAFALERHGLAFRLADPPVRAARGEVDHLLSALADARAEVFMDDDAARRALAPDAARIIVTPRAPGAQAVDVRVGGECPTQAGDVVAVRTAPSLVACCVARALFDALSVAPATLIDASPLFAHADEIEELRVEDVGGVRVEIARRGSGWRERAPVERELDADESDAANALVIALAGARGHDVGAGAPSDAFPARTRVTATRTGASVTEVLQLADPSPDGMTLARRLDDGARLRLDPAAARRFRPLPVALRSPVVWQPAIDPASIVAVDDTCGSTGERLEWRDGAWSLRAPAGFAPDARSVSELTGDLARVRALAWVAEADDSTFGLTGPRSCRVAMTVADGADAAPRRVELVLGDATEGGFYARRSDDPAVFVAPEIVRAIAARPVVDRGRLAIDPSRLASLVVTSGGARRAAILGGDAASPLADAFAGWSAYAALHVGRAEAAEGMDLPTLVVDATSRGEAGPPEGIRLTVGAATQVDGVAGYFARADGVNATFLVPKGEVDAVLAAASRGAPDDP
jgi:hypothetical protein